jgi:hypothetical protein
VKLLQKRTDEVDLLRRDELVGDLVLPDRQERQLHVRYQLVPLPHFREAVPGRGKKRRIAKCNSYENGDLKDRLNKGKLCTAIHIHPITEQNYNFPFQMPEFYLPELFNFNFIV